MILHLQLASSSTDVREGRLRSVNVVVNDRQLRSLTRDLTRAATERGLQLRAPLSWRTVWQWVTGTRDRL